MKPRPSSDCKVGVLALQGSVGPHRKALEALGRPTREVRQAQHLAGLTHLIMPGGESTTLEKLMRIFGLWDLILQNAKDGKLAIFGTCAGAILLGQDNGEHPRRMNLLDAQVNRNAYGRQLDSFVSPLVIDKNYIEIIGQGGLFEGVFIRAPKFSALGERVKTLAHCDKDGQKEIVLIQQDRFLAASFHPELCKDLSIHKYFLSL